LNLPKLENPKILFIAQRPSFAEGYAGQARRRREGQGQVSGALSREKMLLTLRVY